MLAFGFHRAIDCACESNGQSIQSNVMEMLYMITTLWVSCALVEKGPIFCSADVSGVIALLLNSQYLEKFLPPRWNI